MSIRNIAVVWVTFLLLLSCDKEPTNSEYDLGYAYFPVDSGLYRLYQVEDIVYDDFNQTIDTNRYELMEIFSNERIDLEENNSFELKRYIRLDSTKNWNLIDVWQTTPLRTRVEQVEENIRLVKMIFPLAVGSTWDGNAFNTNREDNFEVASYVGDTIIRNLSGLEVVRINHYKNQNIIIEEESYERYAKDIGMVNKYFKYLDLQKDSGLIRTLWIKEFGRRETP